MTIILQKTNFVLHSFHFHLKFRAIISEFLMAHRDMLRICRLLFAVYRFLIMSRAMETCRIMIIVYNSDILYFNKRIFELTACCQIKTEICVVSVGTNRNEL